MKKNKKILKIVLGSAIVASAIIGVPLAVVSCSSVNTSSSNADQYEQNLNNKNIKSTTPVFASNKHNNVNIANVASIVNANELQNIYSILNNPDISNFMSWLSNQKIVVIDGQVPNPAWTRIPTANPGDTKAQISAIQNNFIICSPQLYPILYSSPKNKEIPGLGMQMAMPSQSQSNKANYNFFMSCFKGEIFAYKKKENDKQLFDALNGSATIVLYVYPRTSSWVTTNIVDQALKPLLEKNIQNSSYANSAIISASLAEGFDSLNSPIGIMYLLQSLINGKAYTQTFNGTWSVNPKHDWSNCLLNLYKAENSKASATTINYLENIKPYFTLNTFGYNLEKYGYSDTDKIEFPFAEKYITSLNDSANGINNYNRTLSAYFNATSMLLSLGFVPYYSTYILDPGSSTVPALKNGVVMPTYIKDIYPSIENDSSKPKPNTFMPLYQKGDDGTGIWQHNVKPNPTVLKGYKIGTIFADDWLMPAAMKLYNNGSYNGTNHIIYNTQGDYTLNGESFFTKNNTTAAFNSENPIKNSSISNTGFVPENFLNAPASIGSNKTGYQLMVENSTTGINGQLGNAVMNVFRGFQWFANQIQEIKQSQFQIPRTTYAFTTSISTGINIPESYSYYNWNMLNLLNSNNDTSSKTTPNDSKN